MTANRCAGGYDMGRDDACKACGAGSDEHCPRHYAQVANIAELADKYCACVAEFGKDAMMACAERFQLLEDAIAESKRPKP